MHGRQEDCTEALAASYPIERYRGLPEAVDRLTKATLDVIGKAKVLVRQCVEDDLSASRGEREGALGGGDGLVIHAHVVEMD